MPSLPAMHDASAIEGLVAVLVFSDNEAHPAHWLQSSNSPFVSLLLGMTALDYLEKHSNSIKEIHGHCITGGTTAYWMGALRAFSNLESIR